MKRHAFHHKDTETQRHREQRQQQTSNGNSTQRHKDTKTQRRTKLDFFVPLCLCVFVLNCRLPLLADPWGKDADLAHFEKRQYSQMIPSPACQSPLAKWGEVMIRFHQEVISPADGPRSHFIPSSSQYTLDAIKKYGFFKGVMLGCDRLMRENDDPWVYRKTQNPLGVPMKWDPVK